MNFITLKTHVKDKKTLLNFMVRPAYDNVLASLSILSSWGFTFEQQFKDEFSIPFYSLE